MVNTLFIDAKAASLHIPGSENPSNVTIFNVAIFPNAFDPIDVTVDGIVTLVKPSQLLNA